MRPSIDLPSALASLVEYMVPPGSDDKKVAVMCLEVRVRKFQGHHDFRSDFVYLMLQRSGDYFRVMWKQVERGANYLNLKEWVVKADGGRIWKEFGLDIPVRQVISTLMREISPNLHELDIDHRVVFEEKPMVVMLDKYEYTPGEQIFYVKKYALPPSSGVQAEPVSAITDTELSIGKYPIPPKPNMNGDDLDAIPAEHEG
ncbi:MAG: hypothetical protein Q7S19_00105 [bacterium]|nr:hypothetical protein [bacterium]